MDWWWWVYGWWQLDFQIAKQERDIGTTVTIYYCAGMGFVVDHLAR